MRVARRIEEGKKKKFCTKKCLKVIVVISSCSVFTIYLQVTFVDEGAIDAGGQDGGGQVVGTGSL